MDAISTAPDQDPFCLVWIGQLLHCNKAPRRRARKYFSPGCDNPPLRAKEGRQAHAGFFARPPTAPRTGLLHLATEQELSDFLKSVDKRAFKRTLYHVRNEESALDIVQDSMLKLAEHYGDKPPGELPMLFQRILTNCTLDWFRRQKTRNAVFSSLSDFEGPGEDGADFDLLEIHAGLPEGDTAQSAEDSLRRAQVLRAIETEIQLLPARQREAFLMRYWEEMDVAETAAAMGCSEGSVKTHCFRAVQTLSKALKAKGIVL